MRKALNKYITSLDYAGKILLFIRCKQWSFSCSFTTVVGTPFGIVSDSISLKFFISNGIVQMFLKIMGKRRQTKQNFYIG